MRLKRILSATSHVKRSFSPACLYSPLTCTGRVAPRILGCEARSATRWVTVAGPTTCTSRSVDRCSSADQAGDCFAPTPLRTDLKWMKIGCFGLFLIVFDRNSMVHQLESQAPCHLGACSPACGASGFLRRRGVPEYEASKAIPRLGRCFLVLRTDATYRKTRRDPLKSRVSGRLLHK